MPAPPLRAFQWDLARQVERLDVLLGLLPRYSDWGYQELYLHLEDAVEYPSLPAVARADAYSYEQMATLVEAAQRVGIGVVPIVNLLGHTQYLIKVPALRDLNELRGADGSPLVSGQICPLHPGTPQVAEKLIGDMAPFCTAGKIHVGLDESFHLGKCPRCRTEIAQHGLAYHFSEHVGRLHTLTTRRGLRLGMWADMLNFIPEAIPRLPPDVIAYDWYYYAFDRHPRVELYNFAESDLATPLKARGIEYWGCPMNGAFRYEPLPLFSDRLANIRSWWRRCQRVHAGGMLITSWEAYRLAFMTTTVVDAAAASLWLKSSPPTDQAMLTDGFARVFGKKGAATCARIAEVADRYPFSGYASWEINDHWDRSAMRSRDGASSVEATLLRRADQQASRLPKPFAASVAYRAYLASRYHFVQGAARAVWQLRRTLQRRPLAAASALSQMRREALHFSRLLRQGRRAARLMWRSTRTPEGISQNAVILARDGVRLRAWRSWLRSCRRQPALAFEVTPICGRWQLIFTVVNLAPALQRVSVEQQQENGAWKELHARYTMEFQAFAARPRARVERDFSTPLDLPDQPLRLVLQGVGNVAIKQIVITNGIQTHFAVGPASFSLGRPAPDHGLPEINQRLAEWPLRFKLGQEARG